MRTEWCGRGRIAGRRFCAGGACRWWARFRWTLLPWMLRAFLGRRWAILLRFMAAMELIRSRFRMWRARLAPLLRICFVRWDGACGDFIFLDFCCCGAFLFDLIRAEHLPVVEEGTRLSCVLFCTFCCGCLT